MLAIKLHTQRSTLFPLLVAGVFLIGLVLIVGGFGLSMEKSEPAAVVEMKNTLKFTQDTVRVQVGETVRWNNTSLVVHTVTADPEEATMAGSTHLPAGAEPFNSGNLDPKERFEHTFTVSGTYTYFCIPHEVAKMRGTVIVTSAS